ncbi:CsgG/HfaB family protein [Pusillimonas sp. ANT_WB101]|uniref:CsgG/HfaB family protein n=1 Tax=Pusillimonas sp. ANT_WB101 TaxID=2597356 RepID=UPI0011EFBB8B|nr:CsgG/HfaB family protein [Pusillimonas sp. ANT_WB101]KAA0911513.1 curli production assembly/transport protein CsgG [Pusillimonas sp. ANT_WB101]
MKSRYLTQQPRWLHLTKVAVACSLASLLLGACAFVPPAGTHNEAHLTPPTKATRDLLQFPPPKGKVVVAVYGFRDETGQYKPSPESAFSTAVTQGAGSMLIKALKDSGWFIPVEREDLQSLLTERRVIRAIDDEDATAGQSKVKVLSLMPASIVLNGGIVSYDSNVRTGGLGAQFLGVGATAQYRVDQVGINLRSVDVNTGEVLQSVSTTKTIYSYEIHPSVFKFVNFNDLLQAEGGITSNEPAQLCVQEAVEAAVAHLIVGGVKDHLWVLKNAQDWNNPVIQRYLEKESNYVEPISPKAADATAKKADATATTADSPPPSGSL